MQNTLNERRHSNTEHYKDYTNILIGKMQSGTCDEFVDSHDLSLLYEILAMDHDIFHAFDIKISGLIDDNLESLKGKKLSENGKIVMRSVERYADVVRKLRDFLSEKEIKHYATYTTNKLFYNIIKDTLNEHTHFNVDAVENFKTMLEHVYETVKIQREAILHRTHDLRNIVEDSMTSALELNSLLSCINNVIATNDKNVLSLEDNFFKKLEPIINKLNKQFTDSCHVKQFLEVDENIKLLETSECNLNYALDALVIGIAQ